MDLVAINNEISTLLPSNQTLIVIALVSIGVALLYVSPSGKKFRERLSELMFSNWRLALLGATGIVLSVASGWTTWDGMRNFTREPLLSLMITFGIQGVMLIVAWLIGESFATGMNVRASGSARAGNSRLSVAALQPIAGTAIGILLFVAVSMLILNQVGDDGVFASTATADGWGFLPNGLLLAAIAILLVATLVINAGSEIIGDYLQAIRVIVRSAVLWVMFLACMATSVFFSFDSLFSTIFSKEERVRAAELRAQNQIAGVVNDIGALAGQRRQQERDRLFENDSWKQYDRTVDSLVAAARQAPQALEDYFEKKMRERQKLVAQRQEEKSAAESQQVRLAQRIKVLNDEIARARSVVAQLTPVVEDLKSKIFAKDREVVAKKAEAEAEAGGIGVTAKQGRGPKFREISAQLRILREEKKNLQLQLGEYDKRLTAARAEISRGESEQSTTLGELATLKGRAETANRLIEIAKQSGDTNAPAFDPTDGLRQLERARVAFRQDPSKTRLTNIQSLCASLVGAMGEVPTLKARAGTIDCDPGQANEAAGRVFALNVGLQVLAANCIGGDKLPKTGGADALFGFARKCVQDAGLPSRDTDQLRTQINYLELNRDDKAHRFVVTSNAFEDGNKLAYLALAIAIAIDALVFMSGLFGANAVRSPLSDVPSHKGRSAQQLEAIIDTALQPHPYEMARLVLGAMRPITPQDGFTAEIIVEDHDLHAADLRRVLNAGSSIGAVRHGDTHDRIYQVRAELFEYLSIAAKREYEKDKDRVNLAELERTVAVALLPDVGANAELVLSYMHPIKERHGFMAEVNLTEVASSGEQKTLRSALNAGAVYERVQRVGDNAGHYFIHADFFKMLTNLRGRLLMSGGHVAATALAHDKDGDDVPALEAVSAPVSDGNNGREAAAQLPPAAAAHEPNALEPLRDREQFLATFLKGLGIEPEQFAELSGEAFSAAIAASEAFAVVKRQHASLSHQVDVRDQELREKFHAINEKLEAGIKSKSSSEWAELDAAFQDVDQNWNIIMLLPGGPYEALMKIIIDDLEAEDGAGNLKQSDTLLLHVARRIGELMAVSPRQTTEDWSKLGSGLEKVDDGGDNVRPLRPAATS